jgi:hypothetical protein
MCTVLFLENKTRMFTDFGSQSFGSNGDKVNTKFLHKENILEYSCLDDSVNFGGEVNVPYP